jgi:hypothetical protein
MKNLIFTSLFLLSPLSQAFEIADSQLSFQYIPNNGEGPAPMTCIHERIRDLPDWKVKCGTKEFAVHLLIQEHHRNAEPRTGLEILYLVTDRNFRNPLFSTGTSWVNLKNTSILHSLVLTQSIENDYASLQVIWKL